MTDSKAAQLKGNLELKKRIFVPILIFASVLFSVEAYGQTGRSRRASTRETAPSRTPIQPSRETAPSQTPIQPSIDTPFIELKGEVEQVAFEASKGTGSVNAVAFLPDGKIILTGSDDGYLRAWDAVTGKELKKTPIFDSNIPLVINSIAVSPNGKRIVTTQINKRYGGRYLIIWDAESGKEIRRLKYDEVTFLSFSPDGKKLVICLGYHANTSIICDAESGEKLQTLVGRAAAFSPDGKKIVAGNTIWDAESGKELQKLEGKESLWEFVYFSPDGKKIVSHVSGGNNCIWDVETGKIIYRLGDSQISSAFSSDGKIVVTAGRINPGRGGAVTLIPAAFIWNAESGKMLQVLQGHTDRVCDVAISPDGKQIVTASSDGTARIWDWAAIEKQVAEAEVKRQEEEKQRAEEAARVAEEKRKAEEAKIMKKAEEIARIAEEKRKAEEAKERQIAERNAILARTGAVYWNDEVQNSGFRSLSDYIRYGNSELKNAFLRADAFDRPDIEEQIKAVKAEIADKLFYGEYAYLPINVDADADESGFTMIIPTGFTSSKIKEIVFPVSGVTGKNAPSGSGRTVIEYAYLTKDETLRIIRKEDFHEIARANPDGVFYARYLARQSLAVSVKGDTDDIKELVRNGRNYRVRVWFENLQYSREARPEMYFRVTGKGGAMDETEDSPYPNPFVTSGTETVETISADVLKIEIVEK